MKRSSENVVEVLEINYESAKAIAPASLSLSQASPPTLHMLLALYSIKREMHVHSNVAKKVIELPKPPREKQHILLWYKKSSKVSPPDHLCETHLKVLL